MSTEYVDIREKLIGYKTVPCMIDDCDEVIYATQDFAPDEWYCRSHLPERLEIDHLFDDPTVRI
jgi:hypothetical protein